MARLTEQEQEEIPYIEAAKLDAEIEPLGSRIQTWLPFPAKLAP